MAQRSVEGRTGMEKERKIWDISPTLSSKTAVWPGDIRFTISKSLQIQDGHNIDLGSMNTTFHIGAHADAPSHYAREGLGIDAVDLIPYVGKCQVIDVISTIGRGQRILPKDVSGPITASRVLFRTGTFEDCENFTEDFASLSEELVSWLAGHGVILVGIDTPSVDLFDDKVLESHQALMKFGMRNLEGLVLKQVPVGIYELIALPLKIKGADGSPVRAILRSI
jgi:arylformamidase